MTNKDENQALEIVAQVLTVAYNAHLSGEFPKYFDNFTVEDYKKLGFVFGLITELLYYKHDFFGEQVELFGKKYNGSPITLRLDYKWLFELGWIKE